MSNVKGNVGSLTIICGSMFSGKTEELIRLVRRGMHARKKVQVFKSSTDTRCDATVIRTHDGVTFTALTVPDAATLESLLEPGVQIVGIEEVQFFDEAIVALCQRLADNGVQVIAAGLDQDFRALPFTFMPQLMALADNVMKLHAICKICGEEASRTQRLVDGRPADWNEPTILVGADDSYEARCRRCHRVRNAPKSANVKSSPIRTRQAIFGEANGETQSRPLRNGTHGKLRNSVRNGTNGPTEKNGHGSFGDAPVAEPSETGMDDHGTQLEMFSEE